MKEKQELGPIEIRLDHFFSVMACVLGILFFVDRALGCFTNCFKDSIIRTCVSNGIMNVTLTVFLFGLYRFQRWPSINPVKMGPIDCLVVGIIGVIQLFLLVWIISIPWERVLSSLQRILEFECQEQPIIIALREGLAHEGQLFGIILLVVILVPFFEELLFRYFLYRFLKSRMSQLRAILLTGFIFALLHFNLTAFVLLWVMGIFLISLYEHHGNLVPCIMVHGLFNYISILAVVF
ncbi:MAG: CPBP family intramembrane metalloprotease [Puniceicoccales bacterium]|jgi:membrane protease YdiL (CAAX protease family)|nr:CPBP family intramembrane metalloprotease [Puniceicoccales bacterium]